MTSLDFAFSLNEVIFSGLLVLSSLLKLYALSPILCSVDKHALKFGVDIDNS
jgi:hypothetical protein